MLKIKKTTKSISPKKTKKLTTENLPNLLVLSTLTEEPDLIGIFFILTKTSPYKTTGNPIIAKNSINSII